MLLPECPSCQGRLPLREVFSGNAVCPQCNCELVSKRWVFGLWVFVISANPDLARHLAESWGISFARTVPVMLRNIVCYLAFNLLAWVLLVRYRVKGPPISVVPGENS